ncbi:hypothetical protein R3P38DRAFT_2800700 [Favolaschia claudopus]|uniref:Uncharacterized protein n=1 Tax=Favolaschia claudopus TaxID=2862362 RepID=A0AAV9ZXS4_9AGAR
MVKTVENALPIESPCPTYSRSRVPNLTWLPFLQGGSGISASVEIFDTCIPSTCRFKAFAHEPEPQNLPFELYQDAEAQNLMPSLRQITGLILTSDPGFSEKPGFPHLQAHRDGDQGSTNLKASISVLIFAIDGRLHGRLNNEGRDLIGWNVILPDRYYGEKIRLVRLNYLWVLSIGYPPLTPSNAREALLRRLDEMVKQRTEIPAFAVEMDSTTDGNSSVRSMFQSVYQHTPAGRQEIDSTSRQRGGFPSSRKNE